MNLNDRNNLNPTIDEKEKVISEWNNKPEIKQNGIEAIDKTKYKKIRNSELKVMHVLGMFGVLALLIIACSVGYSVYVSGSLVPKFLTNMTCEAPIINLDKGICPSTTCDCPEIPDCNCPVCPDCNVRTYCGNETG